MKRRRKFPKSRPLIALLPSDTEVAAFMGKLIERPRLPANAIAKRQDGDLEARQVIGHILQCLSQWHDYRQDAAYTEAGKLIAIRRNGQRFEIRVAEIARCKR